MRTKNNASFTIEKEVLEKFKIIVRDNFLNASAVVADLIKKWIETNEVNKEK